jgi:predicted transglutaminase-like cysteine proteinase
MWAVLSDPTIHGRRCDRTLRRRAISKHHRYSAWKPNPSPESLRRNGAPSKPISIVNNKVLARCRAQEACPVVAQNLLDIVAEGAGRSGLARVGLINRAVDLAITPTSDEAQWGVADHWSPPFETLQTHRGDCEDYAIVKYVALLKAGLSHNDVKIVILRNLLKTMRPWQRVWTGSG